jgi:hypothetical protein
MPHPTLAGRPDDLGQDAGAPSGRPAGTRIHIESVQRCDWHLGFRSGGIIRREQGTFRARPEAGPTRASQGPVLEPQGVQLAPTTAIFASDKRSMRALCTIPTTQARFEAPLLPTSAGRRYSSELTAITCRNKVFLKGSRAARIDASRGPREPGISPGRARCGVWGVRLGP